MAPKPPAAILIRAPIKETIMITKTGTAHWEGDLKSGSGTISSQSGALKDVAYGFATRFEGKAGSNPEELIGAAHAACFSMALANMLAGAGITGVKINSTSAISLDRDDAGFSITKAHLTTQISADADPADILEIAQEAKANCPVSRVLNAEVTMDATVV